MTSAIHHGLYETDCCVPPITTHRTHTHKVISKQAKDGLAWSHTGLISGHFCSKNNQALLFWLGGCGGWSKAGTYEYAVLYREKSSKLETAP